MSDVQKAGDITIPFDPIKTFVNDIQNRITEEEFDAAMKMVVSSQGVTVDDLIAVAYSSGMNYVMGHVKAEEEEE